MAEPGDEKKDHVARIHYPDIAKLIMEAPEKKALSINDLMDMNDQTEYKFFIDWNKAENLEDLKTILAALYQEVIDIRWHPVPSKFLKDKGGSNG